MVLTDLGRRRGRAPTRRSSRARSSSSPGVTGATDASSRSPSTKVATGLSVPMGIAAIGDKLYVSEKTGLTELSADTNGDGMMERKVPRDAAQRRQLPRVQLRPAVRRRLLLRQPVGGDQRGRRDHRARSRAPTPAPHLKIDRKTYAGRARRGRPAHAERHRLGPRGRHLRQWTTRAAGCPPPSWSTSSRIGSSTTSRPPAGPFDHKPVTQPALWLPQNEIANSPSTPITAQGRAVQGPDAVRRRHLRRPAARVPGEGRRRVPGRRVPPLGGPRSRRQPRHRRARRRALRRRHRLDRQLAGAGQAPLRPAEAARRTAPTSSTWRRWRSSRAASRSPTRSRSPTTTVAGLANGYRVQQWRYTPTSAVRRPEARRGAAAGHERRPRSADTQVGHAPRSPACAPTTSCTSARRARSPRATAEELWNTEAWYTLNTIPGYKTPAESGFYEAEEAALLGGMQYDTEHLGLLRLGLRGQPGGRRQRRPPGRSRSTRTASTRCASATPAA